MAKLEQALKKMINNAIEYNKPSEIYAGKVESVAPLTIRLDINVPVLEEDELILKSTSLLGIPLKKRKLSKVQ